MYAYGAFKRTEWSILEKFVNGYTELPVTYHQINLIEFLGEMRYRNSVESNEASTPYFIPDVTHLLSKLPARESIDDFEWFRGIDTLMHYITNGDLEKIRDLPALRHFLDRCVREREAFAWPDMVKSAEAFLHRTGSKFLSFLCMKSRALTRLCRSANGDR